MFCVRCGQELPEIAQFCFKCGSAVPVGVPPSELAPETLVIAATKPTAVRPYRWGTFQAWFLLIVSPLFAIGAVSELANSSAYEDDPSRAVGRAVGLIVTCALFFFTGLGILKKRRYGLILVYVILGLICIMVIVGFAQNGPNGARESASGAGLWIASTIYYYKRRNEFRA